jgi:hypothetical protein
MTIFQEFRAMGDRNRQAAFFAGHVVAVPKKTQRVTISPNNKTRRKIKRSKSYKYFLTTENGRCQVCKQYFVATLPVGGKTVEIIASLSVGGIVIADRRGQKPNHQKPHEVKEYIRSHMAHINCFQR